jgi:hypothetical protein
MTTVPRAMATQSVQYDDRFRRGGVVEVPHAPVDLEA